MADPEIRLPKSAVHNFIACTARRWGLRSRVTLVNHTGERVQVGVRIRSIDGVLLASTDDLHSIPDGRSRVVDLNAVAKDLRVEDEGEEHMYLFSLVPHGLLTSGDPVTLPMSEVMRLITMQDQYIEHYNPVSGFASGVCYQTPPLNNSSFTAHYSLLMQAPKVFLSETRNTVIQILHHSNDAAYMTEGVLRCGVRTTSGELVSNWRLTVPAHGMRYVDLKESLEREGVDWRSVVNESGFLFFEAFGPRCTFIPLTMNINERSLFWDMEHSLPPNYYAANFGGEIKKQILVRLLVDRFNDDSAGENDD